MAAEKPRAGYFGRGKTQGGLCWPQKNLGRAILATERPWAGYFGCGKTWAGVILAAEKPCARAHSRNSVFLIHRKPSEELFCEARIPYSGLVLGPGIWRSPVRFPAPRKSFRAHFGVTFSSILGCLGMCLGVVQGCFGMGVGLFWKKCRMGSKNEEFQT